MDGVTGHHVGRDALKRRAEEVAGLLVRACERPSRRRRRTLYAALAGQSALAIVDDVMDELIRLRPDIDALRRIGLWLATTSPDREPVKIGLALLGAAGPADHVDVIRTLGAHDEFTLYAATALQNGLAEPDSELWALAAATDGWGRIECVHRLRNTQDPQIKSWLLREGYRNSILNEYTAFVAAETGGLLAALEQDTVDRALLTAAGEILSALIAGGPAEDIGDYADGPRAIERYVTLMRTRAETLDDYLAVAAIRDFVADAPDDVVHTACLEILGRPRWRELVTATLTPEAETGQYWAARRVARDLGIDTFEVSYRRLEMDPFGPDWFDAWQTADADQARRLVALAAARLPLSDIATGPADTLGLGPKYEAHTALDWSLYALRDHPGIGGDLLIVGLQSPVTRNRNMALNAFQQWPAELWPAGARRMIEDVASGDPNEDTRGLAAEVLSDRPPGARKPPQQP